MEIVKIDLSRKNAIPVLHAMQGDTARRVEVELYDNGIPYSPAADAISVWFSGASGDGNYSDGISVKDNLISIPINPNLTKNGGRSYLAVLLNRPDGKLATWDMALDCEPLPGYGSAAAQEYYEAFEAGELAREIAKLNNRVGSLTAENVGARPDTWMPTAAEVGARPDTWMPTAAEVGVRPDTWMLKSVYDADGDGVVDEAKNGLWLYAATLLVDGWGEAASDGSYTQTAACTPQDGGPTVTASTNLLFPMCNQTGVQATDEALQAALNIINLGTKATGAGTVTCKVWELPECDITVTWPGREENNG